MNSMTVEFDIHFNRVGHGARKDLAEGMAPLSAPDRVPRVARLMALAIRCERLLRDGVVNDSADLARLGQVTRARISQILSLVHLAPDIQEDLLFLPQIKRGRDPIVLRDLLPIAGEFEWRKQRRLWRAVSS